MPSWNDGETSSDSILGDFTDADYAPDAIEDPQFRGIAEDSSIVCRVHNQVASKLVAFEGSNTGRRFYACSVGNQGLNCGFVSWADPEWSGPLKNAIGRLWTMYEDCNRALLNEKIENGTLIRELTEEKDKLDKSYTHLLADVKKLLDNSEKQLLMKNIAKLKETGEISEDRDIARLQFLTVPAEIELAEMQRKHSLLRDELIELKNVQKTRAEMMKMNKRKWDEEREEMKMKQNKCDEEREELKQQKKQLEYMLYDLLKASDVAKDKLSRIKLILDE